MMVLSEFVLSLSQSAFQIITSDRGPIMGNTWRASRQRLKLREGWVETRRRDVSTIF